MRPGRALPMIKVLIKIWFVLLTSLDFRLNTPMLLLNSTSGSALRLVEVGE
jgi:hypothetical protein